MSEIAAFPRSVLKHHYPDVPLRGDFTKIQARDHGPVELLVGGTPCQSFSIAGLRGGLDDERGNLALEFCRLADRLRPRWVLWENVPGVLSSNGGRDFGCFLGALAELGYGFAYRVLDAQYVRVESHAFAVPQRRRRVFVVGYLGSAGWRAAAAVLLERESLRGHSAPSRKAGASVAALTACGVGTCGADDNQAQAGHLIAVDPVVPSMYGDQAARESHLVPLTLDGADVSRTLTARHDGSPCVDRGPTVVVYQCHGSNVGEMGTLRAGNGNETGGVPFIALHYGEGTYRQSDVASPLTQCTDKTRGMPLIVAPETSLCLNAGAMGRQDLETETLIACFDETQVTSQHNQNQCHPNSAGSLAATARPPSIAIYGFENRHRGDDGRGYDRAPSFSEGVSPTVNTVKPPSVASGFVVRRLTPRECERLQGFPDDYTLVIHRKKSAKDSPRYKSLGNSMAVNCMSWLGQRIQAVDSLLQRLELA